MSTPEIITAGGAILAALTGLEAARVGRKSLCVQKAIEDARQRREDAVRAAAEHARARRRWLLGFVHRQGHRLAPPGVFVPSEDCQTPETIAFWKEALSAGEAVGHETPGGSCRVKFPFPEL